METANESNPILKGRSPMAIKADYHLHSYFSGDSEAPMEQMILSGIDHGLTHMCFTEHHDMDYLYQPGQAETFTLRTDSYLYELLSLREKYSDRIHILFGVELGVQPHLAGELSAYINSYPFDFIIASSHLCHRKDPFYPAFYEGRTDDEAYEEYFLSILENLKSFHGFDVYGHLDYAVRYGKTKNLAYSYARHSPVIDEILKLLIALGKGLELNTGGFRCGLNQPNPSIDILKRYHELGGEIITIGSDAHNPHSVCEYFDKARDILTALGFQHYCLFEKHVPVYQRL